MIEYFNNLMNQQSTFVSTILTIVMGIGVYYIFKAMQNDKI